MLRNLCIFCFAAVAQGYTTFETKCSTSNTSVNFVSSADIRGTMDILWSCLFTIIACTWTVQHLNVPEQREGRDPGWRGDVKWHLKGTWSSTKWMLATIIAPELLVGKAWGDLNDAKHDLTELQQFAEVDDVPWSLTHTLFANMGGFVIRWSVESQPATPSRVNGECQPIVTFPRWVDRASQTILTLPRPVDEECQTVPENSISRRTAEIDNGSPEDEPPMQKFENASEKRVTTPYVDLLKTQVVPAAPRSRTQKRNCHNTFHLTASMILALRKANLLPRLPLISLDEINDKSKGDAFARAIAVVQIVWNVVQIITRRNRHLAVSPLEIVVVAFAGCAIVIYLLNWRKPKGVQVPCIILQYREGFPGKVWNLLEDAEKELRKNSPWIDRRLGSAIPNFGSSSSNGGAGTVSGTLLAGFIFGRIHLEACEFVFPTAVEQTLWRTSTLWCTCACLGLHPCLLLGDYFGEDLGVFLVFVIIICLYVLARLYMVVEMFRSLCFLPPDAHIATWATNIPHIA